ncbi:hypothetical protein HaLaN_25252 [Haematococcus lacustris]|uniref:Uncharacterized protein n=1 Tax=Haematococcus lacustris TaxID=44745 RepID=A0A699ZX06_HAELA|nr:hypothetical protein HaLaN_25252 [Haematococcus lacustris]
MSGVPINAEIKKIQAVLIEAYTKDKVCEGTARSISTNNSSNSTTCVPGKGCRCTIQATAASDPA